MEKLSDLQADFVTKQLCRCLPGIKMYTKEYGKAKFLFCEQIGFGGIHLIYVECKDGKIHEYNPDGRYSPEDKDIHIFTASKLPLTALFIPKKYKRYIWFYQSTKQLTKELIKQDPYWSRFDFKLISSVNTVKIDNWRYKEGGEIWFNIIRVSEPLNARTYIRPESSCATVLNDNLIPKDIWDKYYKGFEQQEFDLFLLS